MARRLSATNLAHAQGGNVTPVLLVAFAFDTPIYVHTGLGTISYDGNDYLGVGDLGGIDGMEESEDLAPVDVRFILTGVDATLLAESLDAGNYANTITVLLGYRADDGSLIDTPETLGRFFYEHTTITRGSENAIVIVAQHGLRLLDDIPGQRYTDEDHRQQFASDIGYEHIASVGKNTLLWAGGPVNNRASRTERRGQRRRNR